MSGVWDPPRPYPDTVEHILRLLVFVIRYNPEIDRGVVAAVWGSWLDKVALRPEVSLGIEEHLGTVLIRGAVSLQDTTFGAEKLWKAYFDLVERHYGARMDDSVEKTSICKVARMIASVAGNDEEFRRRADDVMTAVRKGLTPGTAPDQYFIDCYNETRSTHIERERARKGS